jgi:hypothetical protein
MIISGQHTELDEKFIVCHKKSNKKLAQDNFTENEKSVVTSLEWLSLEEIINHTDPIFPVILKTRLSDILNSNYPPEPEWVDLALQS